MTSRGITLSAHSASEIVQLRLRTQFRDGDEVAAYLERNPRFAHALLEALDRIPEFFEDDTPIALEVVRTLEDPEHVDLYALIQTKLAAEDAVSRLKHFDEAWWLNALDHTRGGLTISLEFV